MSFEVLDLVGCVDFVQREGVFGVDSGSGGGSGFAGVGAKIFIGSGGN